MAVSEDHASYWVHKDPTFTTNQIRALLTTVRASGEKDECQVRLTGIEREYWMVTTITRLGGTHLLYLTYQYCILSRV